MEDEARVEEENEVVEATGWPEGVERGLVGGYLRTAASALCIHISGSSRACHVCVCMCMSVCVCVYICVRASCANTRALGSGVGGAYGCTWTDTRCGRVRV